MNCPPGFKKRLATELDVAQSTITAWVKRNMPLPPMGTPESDWGVYIERCKAWRSTHLLDDSRICIEAGAGAKVDEAARLLTHYTPPTEYDLEQMDDVDLQSTVARITQTEITIHNILISTLEQIESPDIPLEQKGVLTGILARLLDSHSKAGKSRTETVAMVNRVREKNGTLVEWDLVSKQIDTLLAPVVNRLKNQGQRIGPIICPDDPVPAIEAIQEDADNILIDAQQSIAV